MNPHGACEGAIGGLCGLWLLTLFAAMVAYRYARKHPEPPEHRHTWKPWENVEAKVRKTWMGQYTGESYDTTVQIRLCSECNLQQTAHDGDIR